MLKLFGSASELFWRLCYNAGVANQVEEIKQKTDIVALIGERVKLGRAGRNFKALCPFHSERTPSFMVSPELGIFKCFGCGKAGDVFTFLQEFDGMEFPEALEFLAKRAGVKLTPFRKDRDFERKERLRGINALVLQFYHYLLTSHAVGKEALRYLVGRGIRKAAMETFGLGFAPDRWDAVTRFLVGRKHYDVSEAEQVGLVLPGRKGPIDRFRNRVIFPLRDVRGNVIGFAGRVLPGDEREEGKYINSPDTELYHKSEHLYGLFENRGEIKKQDNVVVVEGELDAISSWQSGLREVVAIKGTAVTEGQVELLRRYTRNVVLALDADVAGDAATKRGIALADSASLNIKIALLSGGKDPDAIARANPKHWQDLVRRATSVYDYYLQSAASRFDVSTGLGKKQVSEEMVPVLSKVTNTIEQAHYIRKLARLLDVSDETVVDEIRRFERRAALGESRRIRVGSSEDKASAAMDRRKLLELYLLSLLLQGGKRALAALSDFSPSSLRSQAARRIVEAMLQVPLESFSAGPFIASLPAELRELAQQRFLQELEGVSDPELLTREVERVLSELSQLRLHERLTALSLRIKEMEQHAHPTKGEEERLERLKRTFADASVKLSAEKEK